MGQLLQTVNLSNKIVKHFSGQLVEPNSDSLHTAATILVTPSIDIPFPQGAMNG
jgi:hypothetical protein